MPPQLGNELRRSFLSPALQALGWVPRLRQAVLNLAVRLEGGQFYSRTARLMMARHYGIVIGSYSYGSCFQIGAFQRGITIGRYVSIGPGVFVYRRNHPTNWLSTHPFFYNTRLGYVRTEKIPLIPLEIGHDVWIGANVIVTPGCSKIGTGSIIGAGSIVTHDVPAFSIYAGAPARPIGQRFSNELCQRIQQSEWWNLSIDQCQPHMGEMQIPLEDLSLEHSLLLRTARSQIKEPS